MKGEFNLSPSCSSGRLVIRAAHAANCLGSSFLGGLPVAGSGLPACREGCAAPRRPWCLPAAPQQRHLVFLAPQVRSVRSGLASTCMGRVLVVKTWTGRFVASAAASGSYPHPCCANVFLQESGVSPRVQGCPQELPGSPAGEI